MDLSTKRSSSHLAVVALVAAAMTTAACNKQMTPEVPKVPAVPKAGEAPGVPAAPESPGGLTPEVPAPDKAEKTAKMDNAAVGKPAPDFELPDVAGGKTKLSSLRGKVVVLEWYNPDCPFVKWAHGEGPLGDMAARYAKQGVQWLAINSGAPGKQGHGLARNKASLTEYNLDHPILLDESGEVGRAYGATNTPHMYVVGKDGTLLYAGGLDNLPFGRQREQGPPANYLVDALTAVLAGKAVQTPQTKAWGCTVKYAK